jgi:putative endonuclease
MKRVQIGKEAEDRALNYLEQKGLRLIQRNYRSRFGEIDLIMRDGKTVVFIEVRYRRNRTFGGASHSITTQKQQRLLTTAEQFLQQHAPRHPARMDVLALEGDDIEWIKNAFGA